MSNLLTFPSLHICQRCGDELATDGKPCSDCQWEREQFVRAAKRLGIMDERRRKKFLFEAWTVLVAGTSLLVIGLLTKWMMVR